MAKQVLVYKFGLPWGPYENRSLVIDQFFARHRYGNDLIRIERGRRAALRELSMGANKFAMELAKRVEALKVAEDEAKAALVKLQGRPAKRSARDIAAGKPALPKVAPGVLAAKKVAIEEARKVLNLARVARKKAVDEARQLRKDQRVDVDLLAEVALINERANALQVGARALCTCYWGTYLLVESAMNASKSMPLYAADDSPNDPAFRPQRLHPDGHLPYGQIGVQIQKGLPADELHDPSNTLLWIEPVNELAWHSTSRGERRRLARTTLHMRIGSTPKGRPVWASWKMVMHRPLPKGAVIKDAFVTMDMHGPKEEWTVCLRVQVDSETLPALRADHCGKGTVALDIGWRKIGDEIRVATWLAEDGTQGELRLKDGGAPRVPGEEISPMAQLRKSEDIRGIRDKNLDAVKPELLAWLKEQTDLPEWLAKETETLALWKSHNRLASLVRRWHTRRFAGDEKVYADLEAWRSHDDHLWRWEAASRKKGLAHRLEIYRRFAAKLARTYDTLVLENFKLDDIAEVKDKTPGNPVARSNRHRMATSELRIALRDGFLSRGGEVWKTPAANTTRECSVCHHVATFDAEHTILRNPACPGTLPDGTVCGAIWDQDENACANMLARWHYQKTLPPAPVAPPKEDRWAKSRRMQAEKKACAEAMAAARTIELELREVVYNATRSKASPSYTADVYADGVKLGSTKNAGLGSYDDMPPALRQLVAEVSKRRHGGVPVEKLLHGLLEQHRKVTAAE